MMRQRQRDVVSIRADAINMAIKKALEGCLGCAEGYFKLARQHGATEEDIEQAVAIAPMRTATGISRRDLIKLAVAGVASVAVVAKGFQPDIALADCTGNYWGTDGDAQSCCTMPQDFYVGKIGGGTSTAEALFNVMAANQAGYLGTYAYWAVEGHTQESPQNPIPGLPNPHAISPYAWGQMQAQAAYNAWKSGPYAQYIGGSTIFADIEAGNYGMDDSQKRANQQTLQGFLDTISSPPVGLIPGVYTSPSFWKGWIGTDYRASQPFVLWITSCRLCDGAISSPPCNSQAPNTRCQANSILSSVRQAVIGGSSVVMWQYYTGGFGQCPACAQYHPGNPDPNQFNDWDVSIQNPNVGFSPISSSQTYYDSPC